MDIVKKGHASLRKVSTYWNIPLPHFQITSMGELKVVKKVGPQGVLIEIEDGAIVSWVLNM